jgi:hypothetical protein
MLFCQGDNSDYLPRGFFLPILPRGGFSSLVSALGGTAENFPTTPAAEKTAAGFFMTEWLIRIKDAIAKQNDFLSALVQLCLMCAAVAGFLWKLWDPLMDEVRSHPARFVCGVLMVVTIAMALLVRSLQKGVLLAARECSRLEGELQAAQSQTKQLQADIERLKAKIPPADILSKEHRRVVTLINAMEVFPSVSVLAAELSLTDGTVEGYLRYLRHDVQMVERVNDELIARDRFRLTPLGKEYVKQHGIKPTF